MVVRTPSKLEELLAARGSTKRWLAKRLRMHDTQLNKYLSGALPAPANLYERIAGELQVPVSFVTPDPKETAAGTERHKENRPPRERAAFNSKGSEE